MGWQEAINAAEMRLREWVRGLVLEIVDWRPSVRASTDGASDAVAGLPADESYQSDVRRVQHAGFRSRMSQTAGNVIVRRGTRWFSIAEDDGLGVSPDDGDAIHYAPGNTASQVKCASDGSTAIASDTAGGKDTAVNAGTLKVARDTDPVKITGGAYAASSLTLDITDSLGVTGTLVITVAAGALVVTPSAGLVSPAGTFTMNGTINGGADHFKA